MEKRPLSGPVQDNSYLNFKNEMQSKKYKTSRFQQSFQVTKPYQINQGKPSVVFQGQVKGQDLYKGIQVKK